MGLIKAAIIGGAGVYAVKQISKRRAQRETSVNREQHPQQYQHSYPDQQQQWQSTDEKHRLSRSLDSPDFQQSSPSVPQTQPQQYHPHVLQFNDLRSPEQQAQDASRPLYLQNSQYFPPPSPRGNMYTAEFQAEAPPQYPPAYRPQRQQPKMGFVEPDEVLSTSDARSVDSRASNRRSIRDDGKIFLDTLAERAQSVRSDMQGKSPREYLEKVLSK